MKIDPTWMNLTSDVTAFRSEASSQDGNRVSDQKLQELSREFEAILTAQILESLSVSLAEPTPLGEGGDRHGSTLDGLMWLEMARQLTSQRDLGLATSIYQQLQPPSEPTQTSLDPRPSETTENPSVVDPLGSSAPRISHHSGPTTIPPEPTLPTPEPGGTPPSVPAPSLPAGAAELLAQEKAGSGPLRHRPVDGRVSSGYGVRQDPFDGSRRAHHGVDWAAPLGQTVRAATSGTVVFSGMRGGYGNTVIIEHDGGVETLYAHLSELTVSPGERVSAGAPIGAVGATGRATGPHLHFEVRESGERTNPVAWLQPNEGIT